MPTNLYFINEKLCKACGGQCCTKLPGATLPEDFKPNLQRNLKKALKSGYYAIDWWEGDALEQDTEKGRSYFIRPATKEKKGVLLDPSWGGTCIFLGPNGCKLPFDSRPSGCKMLEPKPKGTRCIPRGASKQDSAVAWLKYESLIERIIKSYHASEKDDFDDC